jgi:hypothetical protein
MIPMEEINNEEQINQQLGLHKEVVHNMRYQPWDMGRKLRVLRRAKSYVSQHEGALQQRLAEARTAKDILARGQLLVAKVREKCYQSSAYLAGAVSTLKVPLGIN